MLCELEDDRISQDRTYNVGFVVGALGVTRFASRAAIVPFLGTIAWEDDQH